jgi:peptide/nickel transport system permease protein
VRPLLRAPAVWGCLLFALLALFGPWLAPVSPERIDLAHAYELPSAGHWLGTADNGVDLLGALLHGARLAGVIALFVVGISLGVGTLLGALAGLTGGTLSALVMGLADLLQAFPAVLLNIALLALVAQPGVEHVILSLCMNGWVLYARLARAEVLSLREREFVTAARALGASPARVLLAHLLPNVLGPLVVQATAGFGGAILMESTLSFLGLGPARAVSWGALLDQGSAVLLRFPHVALISGGVMAATVLAFNLAGDTVRDALDPRTRASR